MEIWNVEYKLQVINSGPPRSGGRHLSDIVRDWALRGRVLDMEYANKVICGCGSVFNEISIVEHNCAGRDTAEKVGSWSPERLELGSAWESRLALHHPEIIFHPGELVVEDIPMTIDGATYADNETVSIFNIGGEGALHEFKLTWKSSRRGIEGEIMWMMQDKSYLHGLSVTSGEKWRVAFHHVYWVNGNYSRNDLDPEGGPSYRIYGVRFSDLEIRENWDIIRAHRDRMEGKFNRFKRSK